MHFPIKQQDFYLVTGEAGAAASKMCIYKAQKSFLFFTVQSSYELSIGIWPPVL